jgi:hypothetical protein
MSRWFRFYGDAINDPKILKLPEATRWHWTAILCVASMNGGILPLLDDIAIQLRVTPSKATEIISTLVRAGLLDKTETGFEPHNWRCRQYKSDVSTERVKRFRSGKGNVSETTSKLPQITDTETDDRIGDAGALASAFTPGSKALASAFWKTLGFATPLSIPPEFAGVDWRAIEWERSGWTVDLIEAEARRIGPDKPLTYHEKVFATAFAKRQAPLPVVEIREAEKITVTHGKTQSEARRPGSLIAAIDRRLAALEIEGNADSSVPADHLLCLPHRPV